jgi:LysM repeat protein
MYEVTCFRCSRIVHITPDAERCSVCGEDLRHLLPPAYASKYFYDRAANLAAGGDVGSALAEVERGLNYRESSELHLLGGILAKRLGDADLMRRHVASIPLEDILRQEAEWLLRSHQTRQRTLREAGKARQSAHRSGAVTVEEEALPFLLEDVAPSPGRARQASRVGKLTIGLLMLFIVAGAGWAFLGQGALWLGWRSPEVTAPTSDMETVESDGGESAQPSTSPASSALVTDTQPIQPNQILTPTATPVVPNNLVQQNAPPALAAMTPQTMVDAVDGQNFNFEDFLMQQGRAELAQLQVAATLQGTQLKLRGIVQMDAERQEIIEQAQKIPQVASVDAVDLLVRLPATYTVQAGDTLWDITVKLYGDPSRMQALIDANADVLPSPESLRIDMELKVPAQ